MGGVHGTKTLLLREFSTQKGIESGSPDPERTPRERENNESVNILLNRRVLK